MGAVKDACEQRSVDGGLAARAALATQCLGQRDEVAVLAAVDPLQSAADRNTLLEPAELLLRLGQQPEPAVFEMAPAVL